MSVVSAVCLCIKKAELDRCIDEKERKREKYDQTDVWKSRLCDLPKL